MKLRFWRRGAGEFIRAVTYFGRSQPVNFWDAAPLAEVPGHLARIRDDGFNTVILVVPWRGFQRTLCPSTFDPVNIEKLRRILGAVDRAGLGSILRVGYAWNNDPDSELGVDERGLGLFTRQEVRDAWVVYLGTLKRVAASVSGFRFAFFSWEDLPSIRQLMVHRSKEQRLALAEATGFRAFLRSRYDLAKLAQLYGETLRDYSDVYIPLPVCEAYRTYNEFVNRALGDLLTLGRTVWPRLTMQVRADFDRVEIGGEIVWVENDVRAWDPNLRVSYYFPYMYAQNCGETLSAREALANLAHMMERLSDGGRNPKHFLDQFVFYDESPQFRHWASIDASELPEFLVGAVDVLKTLSRGYGIWNYFDYRDNHLYNPSFLRGLHGWKACGEVSVRSVGDFSAWAMLAPGAHLSQQMVPEWRGNATNLYESVSFRALAAVADAPGRLRLSTNGTVEAEVTIAPGEPREVTAELRPGLHRGAEVAKFSIENFGSAPVELTELCVWGFVYRSCIYDEEGRPGRLLQHIRAMNHR